MKICVQLFTMMIKKKGTQAQEDPQRISTSNFSRFDGDIQPTTKIYSYKKGSVPYARGK